MTGETYTREHADDVGWAPRRRALNYTTTFRPVRRDMTAPILQLINGPTAACASDPNPDRWFDRLNGGGSAIADQKRLCAHCPLLRPCQEYALANDVVGIWGGTTAADRVRIRQQRGIKAEPVSWMSWLRGDA